MKDSQDWLVVVTGLYADYYANKITLGELIDGVNSIVREHFLKEALELIGKDKEKPDILHDAKLTDRLYRHEALESYGRLSIENQLRQELRNKFNDKYKED